MNEGSVRSAATALVGVALVAAAGVFRLGGSPPLETPKAPVPETAHSHFVSHLPKSPLEKIPARLWEDPFEAYGDQVRKLADANETRRKAFGTKTPERTGDAEAQQAPTFEGPFDTPTVELTDWLGDNSDVDTDEVVVRARCAADGSRVPPPRKHELAPECRDDAPARFARHLLVVTSPSARMSGNAELRRQIRVALQTAMRDRGWATRDEASMGAMIIAAEGGRCAHVNRLGAPPLRVFFETFVHPAGAKAVSVWVDEDDIRSSKHLAAITRCLQGLHVGPRPFSASVIGPSKSAVLLRWIHEDGTGDPASERLLSHAQPRPGELHPATAIAVGWEPLSVAAEDARQHAEPEDFVPLYSPVSTVPEASLFALSRGAPRINDAATSPPAQCVSGERTLACYFARAGFRFERAVATDAPLVELLTNEIGLRSYALKPRECHVIVVTEADSAYARWFKEEVHRRLPADPGQTQNPHGPCSLLEAKSSHAIGTYQYLRTINVDDRKPRGDGAAEADSGGARLYGESRVADAGRQQFDYIERLAERIERDVLARRWDAEHVFAIGLFGIDTQDKITLLKALRPRFPHARFATTDLDAAYLKPDHLRFTRNLIIASHHDLESGDVGLGMPPFRHVRQVAYARSFAAALERAPVRLPSTPGLYEVGLHGFIRLNRPTHDGSDGAVDSLDPYEHCGVACALDTKWNGLETGQRVGGVVVVLALLTVLGVLAYRFFRVCWTFIDPRAYRRKRGCGQKSQRAGVVSRWVILAAILLSTAYFWLKVHGAYAESAAGKGEPLHFFEGASLWVPVLIRGLTITIGVVAFIVFLGGEREAERRIARELKFFHDTVTRADEWFRQQRMRRLARNSLAPALWHRALEFLPLGRMQAPEQAALAWRRFERRSCALGIVAVALGIAGYFGYLGFLAIMDDPTTPSRGAKMASLNAFAIRMTGIVVFALAFAVFLKQNLVRHFFEVVSPDACWRDGSADRRRDGDSRERIDDLVGLLKRHRVAIDGDRDRLRELARKALLESKGSQGAPSFDVLREQFLDRPTPTGGGLSEDARREIGEAIFDLKDAATRKRELDRLETAAVYDWTRGWGESLFERVLPQPPEKETQEAANSVESARSEATDPPRPIRDAARASVMLDFAEQLLERHTWPIYVPVLMLSLVMLARISLFENQSWPPVFWLFLAVTLVLSLWNAFRTYRLAHRIRTTVIETITAQRELVELVGAVPPDRIQAIKALFDAQLRRAQAIRHGPFAPLAEQPFVLALGIPLSGTVLVEILSWSLGLR